MPSGQTAIAFASLTIIWLTTRNVVIFTVSLVLALIIAINRYDQGKRSKSEIIIGACVGIMIVILLYGLAVIYINANTLTTFKGFFNSLTIF